MRLAAMVRSFEAEGAELRAGQSHCRVSDRLRESRQVEFCGQHRSGAVEGLEALRFLLQNPRNLPPLAREIEARVDARQEFASAERLGQVIIGAGRQALDTGLFAGARREQNY